MNLDYIINKLHNYGLSFDDYQNCTGNLVGKVSVPNALKAFNKHLTVEESFYLVTNKVYEVANQISFGIPGILQEEYSRIVSSDDIRIFKEAIFEEVNHRFIANSFPEFEKSGSLSFPNISYNPSTAGGYSIQEWINPLSQQKIASIDWRKYDDETQLMRDRVYLYRNMTNANLGIGNLRVLGATPTGSITTYDHNTFAQTKNLSNLNETVNSNFSNQVKLASDFNQVKTDLYNKYATVEYVNDVSFAIPKMKAWDKDTTYTIPSFVIQASKIYWNAIENNIGNIPGGITGEGKWILVNEIVTEFNRKDVVYAPGTDIKSSYKNPNQSFYVDLAQIIKLDDLNVDKLFTYLNNNVPVENLQLSEVAEFYENICGSDPEVLKRNYSEQIAWHLGEVKLFSLKHSETTFEEFKAKYNLVIGKDFEMLEDNKFLHINDTVEQLGGSNFIQAGNLPLNTGWELDVYQMWDTTCSVIRSVNVKGHAHSWREPLPNGWLTIKNVENDNNLPGTRWHLVLNGLAEQYEFKPEYLNVAGIRFLKDIPATNLKRFANVVSLSLLGQVVKRIDGIPETLTINKLKRGN